MIERLACKLGRNDEKPNIELAEYLCQNNDTVGIDEIANGLKDTDKAIVNDCIKVLYEIGDRNPALVLDYAYEFISYLRSKNNRLAWGSMMALAKIAEYAPEPIFEKLPVIVTAYEEGSVITVDNSISVFAGLCKIGGKYSEMALPILLNHLSKCKPKEVPQHAERASVCFNKNNANAFVEILEKRLPHLVPTGQTRIRKLLKTLHSLQN